MKKFTIIIMAVGLFSSNAAAIEFYNNKTGWNGMSTDRKHGYVAGIMEEATSFILDREYNMYSQDISDCMFDLELDTGMLIEIVNNQYQDLSNWEEAPKRMLLSGVRKVCLAFMNRARTERGDELLNP